MTDTENENGFSFRWGVPDWDNEPYTKIPNPVLDYYHRVPWTDKDGNTGEGISNTEAMFIIQLARYRYESSQGRCTPALTSTLKIKMCYKSHQGIINIAEALEHKNLLTIDRTDGKRSEYDFTALSTAIQRLEAEEKPSRKVDGSQSEDETDPSRKVDGHPSRKVDGSPDNPSTKVDGTRQEKLTRRRNRTKPLKEEKDKKKAADAASPAPSTPPELAKNGPDPPLQVFKPGMDFLDMASVTEQKQAEMRARGIDNPAEVAAPFVDWPVNDEQVKEILLEFMALSGLQPATEKKRKGWEAGARECFNVFGSLDKTLAAIGVFFRIRADDDDERFKHEVYSPHSIVNGLGMIRDNGGNNDGRQRRPSGQPDGRKIGATGSGRTANRRSSSGVASEKDPYAVYRRRTRAAT